MKRFSKFLKETKGDSVFKTGSFDMANTEGKFRKSEAKKITKQLQNLGNKTKSNPREKLIQGRKSYIDPKTNKASEEGIKRYITKARNMASGSNVNTKANQKAAEIISKSAGKEYADKINQKYGGRLARKRPSNAKSLKQIKRDINLKNPVKPGITGQPIPAKLIKTKVTNRQIQDLIKSIPGKSKNVSVTALDKRDASIKKLDDVIIKPQKDDAKKTKDLIKKLEKDITKPKKGEVKAAKELVKQSKPGVNTSIFPSKSGNKVKTTANKVTTNVTNTKDPLTTLKPKRTIPKPPVTTNVTGGKGFVDRVMQGVGIKNPVTKKLSKTNKVTGLSTKDLSKLKTKARIGGVLKGAGRFAGGAFAVKDAYDKARVEKAKGRSKTSQVLAGIARGAGGYLGGAVGAAAGTLAGGGLGSAVLGTGGAIAGYNVGSKIGDQIYKTGRKLATGKTFKNLRKDISKGAGNVVKGTKNFFDTSGNP